MRVKKLLLLLTGGTICSFPDEEGVRDADTDRAEPLLVQALRNSRSAYRNYEIEVRQVTSVLSENMTVKYWNQLLEVLREIVDYHIWDYAGILIAHGTDSLHFTAPLLDFLMTGSRIPVMLVAADLPLTDPRSNGRENLIESVEWILNRRVTDGAWLIYRNQNGNTYLHRGSHLLPAKGKAGDFFSLDKEKEPPVFRPDEKEIHRRVGSAPPLIQSLREVTDCVLKIDPYVGLNYGRIGLRGVKAVCQNLYHSGTCCTEEGTAGSLDFLRKCRERNIDFYINPCQPDSVTYDSTRKLLAEGAKTVFGMTENAAYVKILLSYAIPMTPRQRELFLATEIADEMVLKEQER